MNTFPEIKKNFGFGCMRLPMVDGEVDIAEFDKMVDAFIGAGFNYFDTAHGYLGGKSETALKSSLPPAIPARLTLLPTSFQATISPQRRTFAPSLKVSLRRAAWITLISI